MAQRRHLPFALLAASLVAAPAWASCGSSFCTLMTDRYAQGAGAPHLGWSADLRLETVTQKKLRTGTRTLEASQVSGEEAIERHTKNLNLVTGLSYGLDADWSFTLRVPVVRREHRHDLLDEESGLPTTPEQWRFAKLGDVQITARRQFVGEDDAVSYAVYGGLKLPTGSVHIRNAEGTRAERALQPGSGTTDLVLGAAARQALGGSDAVIGQFGLTQALNSREDFKPGQRLELSLGWSHALSPKLGTVLQLNARHRGRDAGAQAEPGNSGSTTLDLSPGITLGVGSSATVYAYLQLPLYQKVNGIQLVPRSALAVGWTSDF